MEREIIERLAIDNALGELGADAAALFEDYLAEHPETHTWAESMAQTCRRTHAAIESKTQSPAGQGPPITMPTRRFIGPGARILGRWAAVIFILLSVGVGLGRRSIPQAPTTQTTIVEADQPAPAKGWDRVLAGPKDGFWQTKALAVLQGKSYEVPRPGRPQTGLWDRYRQSRKERSYE